MTPQNRLTEKLTSLEARCTRLESANAELEAENYKLAAEMERITSQWVRDFERKSQDQHEKHAPIAALFTEGDGENIA